MIEVNKFKTGLFVLAGITVILGAILIFGGSDVFKDEVTLVTLYNESVQGLEKGSQVKFRGVPIGKVTEIAIMQNDSKIRIKMQIDPGAFISEKTDNAEIMANSAANQGNDLRMFIKNQIKKGLQVRMEFAGITGFKYIELNYFNEPSGNLLPPPTGLQYDEIYIPAAPSMLSDVIQNISKSLDNISKIHFDKISASLENSASKINEFINDDTLQDTVNNLRNITARIDRTLTDERMLTVMDELQRTISQINAVAVELNNNDNINKTVNSIHSAGNAVTRTSEDLENTLFKLNTALDKLTMLINLLNENPSALIRGKEASPLNIK